MTKQCYTDDEGRSCVRFEGKLIPIRVAIERDYFRFGWMILPGSAHTGLQNVTSPTVTVVRPMDWEYRMGQRTRGRV